MRRSRAVGQHRPPVAPRTVCVPDRAARCAASSAPLSRSAAPPLHCAAVNVLAIDQGTSSTKALVVAPDGRRAGRSRGAGASAAPPPTAASSRIPRSSGSRSLDAGRQALAQRRRADRGASAWPTRARPCWPGIAPTGRPLSAAISWQDRRALGDLRRTAERTSVVAGAHRAAARSLLRRARRCAGCAST